MAASFGVSLAMIAASLGLGVCGYHWIADLPWIDSLLNAAMILGGMGPVDRLTTSGSKLFASAYAIFSGLVFISVMGVVLAPVIHRVIHKFHLDSGGKTPTAFAGLTNPERRPHESRPPRQHG